MIYDYEFGWTSVLCDWAIFQVTRNRYTCIKKKFQSYKFVKDAARSVRP